MSQIWIGIFCDIKKKKHHENKFNDIEMILRSTLVFKAVFVSMFETMIGSTFFAKPKRRRFFKFIIRLDFVPLKNVSNNFSKIRKPEVFASTKKMNERTIYWVIFAQPLGSSSKFMKSYYLISSIINPCISKLEEQV